LTTEAGWNFHAAALPSGLWGERAEIQLKPAKEVSHRAKTTVNRNATKGFRSTSMPLPPVPLPFNFTARREVTGDPLVESALPASGLDRSVECLGGSVWKLLVGCGKRPLDSTGLRPAVEILITNTQSNTPAEADAELL
jgi:hypothetical protein